MAPPGARIAHTSVPCDLTMMNRWRSCVSHERSAMSRHYTHSSASRLRTNTCETPLLWRRAGAVVGRGAVSTDTAGCCEVWYGGREEARPKGKSRLISSEEVRTHRAWKQNEQPPRPFQTVCLLYLRDLPAPETSLPPIPLCLRFDSFPFLAPAAMSPYLFSASGICLTGL